MKEAGPLDQLIRALAVLPGLGPRSARRIALHLLVERGKAMEPLVKALAETAETVRTCTICGNLDTVEPCRICRSDSRQKKQICVIAGISDLWAIERTGAYRGVYHTLGGVLSALDGVLPERLRIDPLIERVQSGEVEEVILALSATVDGQATAHYVTDRLHAVDFRAISRLAHGVPVGGELDYLDDGTIATALKSRAGF